MVTVSGLIVGRHPDSTFSWNRALVFADAAADALPEIHMGPLKPYSDLNPGSRKGR